jgi:GNAT superfamily N-acetyltransferase
MTEPTPDANAGLPRALGDGLILRWATPADSEAVAAFNARHLSDNPDEPDEGTAEWTRTLMGGTHPTTRAGDFTVVVDEHAGGRIVSSLCVIPQTWAYAGIPFKVGRPELVSTDPAYRRRGLVRAQFAAIHARGAARGELLQVIDGVAWYYRQFGYEMALNMGGSRRWLPFRMPAPDAPDAPPAYRLRPATPADIPLLDRLYAGHCAGDLVTRVRDAAEWRYELGWKQFRLVEDAAGAPVGYVEARANDGGQDPEVMHVLRVSELAVLPGHSLRAVALCLGPALQAELAALNATRAQPLTGLALNLGPQHPAYTALGDLLEQYRPYYAWYVRVPALPAFLRHIAPVLEARLAGSVLAGHSGTLRLNFYQTQMALTFAGGRLAGIGSFTPAAIEDGDARFPVLTFLHVLLGHHTPAEIAHLYADCYVSPAAAVLLGILFPPQPSNPVPLA